MVENIYGFKKDLDKDGVIFCFSGVISQDILTSLTSIIEKKLEEYENSTKAQNIFAVFVEMVQNIMSYSSDSVFVSQTQKQSYGIIILGYDYNSDKYYIKSANSVQNSDKQKIIEKIDNIKNLSKDELRTLYKEYRKSGENSHERGGGLGFIEIQRKSSSPLEYKFNKVDEHSEFFCLEAII